MNLRCASISCVFILLSVLCSSSLGSWNRTTEEQKWHRFKNQTRRQYKDAAEEAHRREIWREKQARIEAHNEKFAKGEVKYQLGENMFSDLTYEEIAATHLNLDTSKLPKVVKSSLIYPSSRLSLPATVDYRTDACMAAIKNQKSCGSCYSFAAINPLEFDLCQKTGKLTTLSEQQVVDCTSCLFGFSGNGGCNGGYYVTAWEKLKENPYGINSDQTYPYRANWGLCFFHFNMFARAAAVSSYGYVSSENATAIQEALFNKQLVAVAVAANSDFVNYKSGIFTNTNCNAISVNHAVVLVGYGSESGTDFWIVRNSWGTTWGINGYMKIQRGINLCFIERYPAIVTASN